MVAFAIADLGGELPVARDVEPSDGRACCFSIERAPQINLRRWPPCLAHPLRCARPLEDPLWGELLNGNPRLAFGIGASRSLPGAPAKVSSLCFADLHHQNLRPGEPPDGQPDGGEGNEGGQGFGKVFEVLGETPVASEPGESALDNPVVRTAASTRRLARPCTDRLA